MTTIGKNYDLRAIAGSFHIPGDFIAAAPYGSGHINDTFAATFRQGGTPVRYILQRINHNVFKQPEALMQNVERVCAHVRAKLEAAGTPDASRRGLTLIPARDGRS